MGKKRSILIVDDDVDASQMAKMLLDQTGLYAVSICNQGSEAFEVIRNTQPELVLLDVMMPGADGPDIAARIRKERSLAGTQVVFMTSLVSEEEVHKHSTIGGHPFISKPIIRETFLHQVKGFFELEN